MTNFYGLEKRFSNYNKRNNINNNLEDTFTVDGLGTAFGSISTLNLLHLTSNKPLAAIKLSYICSKVSN